MLQEQILSPTNGKSMLWRIGFFLTACVGICLSAERPVSAERSEIKVQVQTKQTWKFPEQGIQFTNDFPQARLNGCEAIGPGEFKLTISPENEPINPSPWYAFKVTSERSQTLTLHFHASPKVSPLRPRTSHDGKTWTAIERSAFVPRRSAESAKAKIQVSPAPLYVSMQEMIGLPEMNAWMDQKCALPFAQETVIGHSIEGLPIRQITLGKSPERVFIISRQHPPEITGSIGLMAFVDTLTGDTDLAQRFRKRFQITIIPVVNPDGIVHGHWRSNLGGVDTNRDWKAFSQPETRTVRDALLKEGREEGAKPYLFLDFHSTGQNVFYTQPASAPSALPTFTRDWLTAIDTRFPEYNAAWEEAHNVGVATSKTWAYETFKIPAITYELSYELDRDLARKVSAGAAEEMMLLLLATPELTAIHSEPPEQGAPTNRKALELQPL